MKKFALIIALSLIIFLHKESYAQLTTPQASPKAKVMQRVGITDITITYYRPAVRGRKVWGSIVPYSFNNLGFGTATAAPWRAGANDNTIIEFTHDVKIEGEELKAGKYGLHMAIAENGEVTVIFSKNYTSWGSYFYNEEEDALRVKVKWEEAIHTEFLKYEFTNMTQNSTLANLVWEKKKIPFKIEVDVHKVVIAHFKDELRSSKGFNYQAWVTAAGYCVQSNVALEQGLEWANAAISAPFVGQKNYTTLSTKAGVLTAMGKTDEAMTIMEEALPLGTVSQVHGYGRQLIALGEKEKALEVFKWNAKHHKDTWPVNWGLARGYSANANFKSALKYAKLALKNAPNPRNESNIKNMIKKLEREEDIN